MPNAGPLYVDYATIDEIPEATKMETMPLIPQHYASESSLLEATQKFNHSFDEKNYDTFNQQFIREQQQQQRRRRLSNEAPPQR